jgi:hypothetical protein
VVEHSPHKPKVKGLSLATAAADMERERKVKKKFYRNDPKSSIIENCTSEEENISYQKL